MSEPAGPPGRKVVVVREGPDRRRPILIDAAVGIVGALLLLGSIVLVDVLPEDEVVEAQYRANFGEGSEEFNTVRSQDLLGRPLAEGETLQADYDADFANIFRVDVGVYLEDDLPATNPDAFLMTLVAPNGTEYPYTTSGIATIPNEEDADSNSYRPIPGQTPRILSFNLAAKPSSYFFTATDLLGEPGDFQLFEIKAALEARHNNPSTAGTWQVLLTLQDAGDCPATDPFGTDLNRAVRCPVDNQQRFAQGTAQGDAQNASVDSSNHVTISTVTFSYFAVLAPEEL